MNKKIEPLEIEEQGNHKKNLTCLFKYKIYILLSIIILGLLIALIVIVTLPAKETTIASSNPIIATKTSGILDSTVQTIASTVIIPTSIDPTTIAATTIAATTIAATTIAPTTIAATTIAATTIAATTIAPTTIAATTITATTIAATTIAPTTTKVEIDENSRVDCFPNLPKKDITKEKCDENVLCIYQLSDDPDTPTCFYDANQQNNILIETTETELGEIHVIQIGNSRLASQLKVEFEQLDDSVLRFKVKFSKLSLSQNN